LTRFAYGLFLGLALAYLLGISARRFAASLSLHGIRTELSAALWLLASAPWIWLAAFAALVVRARGVLGAWPRAQQVESGSSLFDGGRHPAPLDPAELGAHYDSLFLSMHVLPITLPVAAVLAMVSSAVLSRREVGAALVLAIAGAAGFFALAALDPGGFFDWFVD